MNSMSVEHKCTRMPKGVKSVVHSDDGWHINFGDQLWIATICFCPWCGRKFTTKDDNFYVPNINRVSTNAKAVRCIDTGETFESIAAAARAHGANESGIIRVCKGKAKQTKGERWEFVGASV